MKKKSNTNKAKAAKSKAPRTKKASKQNSRKTAKKIVAVHLKKPQPAVPKSLINNVMLSMQDICRVLDISQRTFKSYLKDHILPYYKIRNRIWLSDAEAAEAFEKFKKQ